MSVAKRENGNAHLVMTVNRHGFTFVTSAMLSGTTIQEEILINMYGMKKVMLMKPAGYNFFLYFA